MSRSGLSEDDGEDVLQFGRWRGATLSAIRGKRGQAFLRELLTALDAMPDKQLIHGELQTPEGQVCAIGCLGAARGLDMAKLDVYDYEAIAKTLGINEKLVQEVEWINDEWGHGPEGGAARWRMVRKWVVEQLTVKP